MKIVSTDSHRYPGYQDKEKDRVDSELKGSVKVDTYIYHRENYANSSWIMEMFAFYPDDKPQ